MRVKPYALKTASMAVLLSAAAPAQQVITANELRSLPKIAEVDPNFQSFNVEMVEVTGGRFWASYASKSGERYAQRPPINLRDTRLRLMVKALAPAYMRVSGTWANSTYIPTMDEKESSVPPAGFKQVLKRDQWREVIRLAKDLDLQIVTSFPVSAGTRDGNGAWTPEQARRLLDMTKQMGGSMVAVEFANEPNLTKLGGLPEGYGAPDYARDFTIFRTFMDKAAPETIILGPGTSGEGGDIGAADIMRATERGVDAVSYHFYGALSQRCADFGNQTSSDLALGEEWLSRTEKDHDYYATLRDQHEPDKPIWLTETAQAACGGSPWAVSFRDTFRYVDQLGRLARKGVKVVAHNTLVASDYALIDDVGLAPRPSFWAAMLWRRVMGKTVLERPNVTAPYLKLYAHCLRGSRKGVAVLAENLGSEVRTISLPGSANIYVITAETLDAKTVMINGREPKIAASGALPRVTVRRISGSISLPRHSISFLTMTDFTNPACALER